MTVHGITHFHSIQIIKYYVLLQILIITTYICIILLYLVLQSSFDQAVLDETVNINLLAIRRRL